MLLHFDDAGEIVWQKGFVSEFYPVGIFRDASSGNLTLIGNGSVDGAVVVYCLDASGNILTIKQISFPPFDGVVLSAMETMDGAIAALLDDGFQIVLKITKQGDMVWAKRIDNNNFQNGQGDLLGELNGNLIVYMQGLHSYQSYITVLDSSGAVMDEIFLGSGYGHILFDGVSGFYGVNGYYRTITRFDLHFNALWTLEETSPSYGFIGAQLSSVPGALTLMFTRKIMNIDSLGNVFDVMETDSNNTFLGLDHQIVQYFSRPSVPGLDSVIACYGSMNGQILNSCLLHPSSISFYNSLLPGNWDDTAEVFPIVFTEQSGTCFQLNLQNTTADYCPYITSVSEVADDLFQVYPLPADDVLHISFEIANGECKVLECFNLHGELLFSEKVSTGNVDFSTSSFPSGVYFLRLGLFTQKIVVQH
jgi:hypothetical protein